MGSQPHLHPITAQPKTHESWVKEALDCGAIRAKATPVSTIALGHWIKLQCQYQCEYFCRRHTCPTLSPTSSEMSEILLDYQRVLFIQTYESLQVHDTILTLEQKFKQRGFYKAFGLDALPCNLCEICNIEQPCAHPDQARPTLQACGIDLPQTLKNIGWSHPTRFSPCSDSHPIGLILVD